MGSAPGTRPAVPVALGAVALLVVVAVLAAGSGDGDAAVGAPGVGLSSAWLDLMLGGLGALTLVVWIALVIGAMSDRQGTRTLRPSRTIPGMLLAGALMWFLFTVWSPSDDNNVIEPPPIDTTPSTLAPVDPSTEATGASETSGLWMLLGAGIVLVGVAALAWVARPRAAAPSEGDELKQRRDLLVGLLDDALADLRGHPNPRQAVIAAWARLEAALATVDVARLPSDTPARYLARVLETVAASAAAVERFTQAFERAMFSPDDITAVDQRDAVDALTAVRDELHLIASQPSSGTRP